MPKNAATTRTYMVSPDGLATLQQQLATHEQEYAELRAKLVELHQLKDAEEYDLVDDNMRLAALDAKIQQLRYTLAHCKVSTHTTSQVVGLGSKVRLECNGKQLECLLVSALEADPSKGRISDQSPLGRALLGKMAHALVEVVAPKAKMLYRIVGIES